MSPQSVVMDTGRIITVANNIKSGYACDAMVDPITGKVFVSASRLVPGVLPPFGAGFSCDVYRKSFSAFTCADLLAAPYYATGGYSALGQVWQQGTVTRWFKNNAVCSYTVPVNIPKVKITKIWLTFSGYRTGQQIFRGLNPSTVIVTGAINGTIPTENFPIPYTDDSLRWFETDCNYLEGETINIAVSLTGNDSCQLANIVIPFSDTKVWGIYGWIASEGLINLGASGEFV